MGKKDTNEVQSVQEKKNKTVHNRGNFRMELSHNGKFMCFFRVRLLLCLEIW